MGAPKPCLGYPNRQRAVVALAGEGLTTAQIVERINAETPADPVDRLKVARLRHAGRERRPKKVLAVRLRPPAFETLKAAALARGTSSDLLARRLIEAALADNLITAILDDGGDA